MFIPLDILMAQRTLTRAPERFCRITQFILNDQGFHNIAEHIFMNCFNTLVVKIRKRWTGKCRSRTNLGVTLPAQSTILNGPNEAQEAKASSREL